MEVKRIGERGSVTMSQKKYIESLLATYGMQNCRSASTPLEPRFQVSCQDDDCTKVNTTEYQSLIEHQTAAKHI